MSFSREEHTLSARELAARTAIPVPSVYRYLNILRETGLVVDDQQGGFCLSARVMVLSEAAFAAERLNSLADPVMRKLADRCGETVLLVRLLGNAAVCVHRIESSHRLRISYVVGQPLPLHRGASARLLLASMPEGAREAEFAVLAKSQPDAVEQLRREVRLAARRGWATSSEEIDPGVWAAAAAVGTAPHWLGVISVPSPLVRAPRVMREKLLSEVCQAARELNELL